MYIYITYNYIYYVSIPNPGCQKISGLTTKMRNESPSHLVGHTQAQLHTFTLMIVL